MNSDYWYKKEFSNKLSTLERRLKKTAQIKDKRKRLSELLNIRRETKLLLSQYENLEVYDNFFLNKIKKNIRSFIFNLEKEYAKK